MKQLFKTECNVVIADFGLPSLKDTMQFAKLAEVKPVFIDIESEDCEWVSDDGADANAFGVYIRYNDKFIEETGANPSDWIADFKDRQSAESLANILNALIK